MGDTALGAIVPGHHGRGGALMDKGAVELVSRDGADNGTDEMRRVTDGVVCKNTSDYLLIDPDTDLHEKGDWDLAYALF